MLVPIYLVQAGSAARPPIALFEICVQNATGGTPSPDCSTTGPASTFTGNAPATVQLSVINDKTSTVQITAATITVPPQLRVIPTTAAPSKYVSSNGQTISFTGINLPGGKSFTATFGVNVACGGTADWKTTTPAQSATGSGSTFQYQDGSSFGVPSKITTACHLGFVNQPTDTQNASSAPPPPPHYIRDGGASTGNPISIGLFDESGNPIGCPTGWDNCMVTVGKAQSAGTLSGTLTKQLSAATFDDLTMSIGTDLADQFTLTATAVDAFAPPVASASFLVAQTVSGLTCVDSGNNGKSCSTNGIQKVSGGGADSFVDLTSSSGFNFMTLSPFTLASRSLPAGCTGLPTDKPLGITGFAESDSRRPSSGTITIRYYVNKDVLSARYGKNVGNQFVPMCVGARPVDSSGVIHDCNDPTYTSTGWLGDAITSNGKFAGGPPVPAVCDDDGYYYGIISSYQDKLDPSTTPTVTNWGGTQIGGDNYRFFDMSIPPGWDWRSGP